MIGPGMFAGVREAGIGCLIVITVLLVTFGFLLGKCS